LLVYSFLLVPSALLLLGLVTGAGGEEITAGSATITIDATAPLQGYVNPLVFGHNLWFFNNTLWDRATDYLKTEEVDNPGDADKCTVKSRIEKLAPTILRFPGGRSSDEYFWEEGLRDVRTPYKDDNYAIIEHFKLVAALGAEALLTVYYGLNDPMNPTDLEQRIKRAQALVAFCNGRTDDTRLLDPNHTGQKDPVWETVAYWARKRAERGFPKPFDVRYWQVGNEPIGPVSTLEHTAIIVVALWRL
jgi:hypothetical protein